MLVCVPNVTDARRPERDSRHTQEQLRQASRLRVVSAERRQAEHRGPDAHRVEARAGPRVQASQRRARRHVPAHQSLRARHALYTLIDACVTSLLYLLEDRRPLRVHRQFAEVSMSTYFSIDAYCLAPDC